MAAAAALVLALAGASGGLAFALGGRSSSTGYGPARPFTRAERRVMEAELLAAAPGKPNRYVHISQAAELARSHGQVGLAIQIAGLMPGGCHAAGYPFHLSSALRMLRESPTAPES